MSSVNSNLELRQVVMKFVFLFQCLITSIWRKIHFSKPFFVLKKSLIFHGIFLPKVLLAAVFINSGICKYYSMLQTKKELNGTLQTEIMVFLFLKCSSKFLDTISYSETNDLGKFYMHQKHNVPFTTKNLNFAFFPWTLLGYSEENTDIAMSKVRNISYPHPLTNQKFLHPLILVTPKF